MSYWIYLEDANGNTVLVECHEEGGTYVLGGTNTAELNLTWNYCSFYYDVLDKEEGIKWLQGKQAKDTIQRLQIAVEKLSDNPSDNYWESTSGNAGHALTILLSWASQHPEAIWRVS